MKGLESICMYIGKRRCVACIMDTACKHVPDEDSIGDGHKVRSDKTSNQELKSRIWNREEVRQPGSPR